MNKHLNLSPKEFTLDNGLKIFLLKENSLPIVSVNLWYHAGSSAETKGKTGLAHLFEHMMFEGSLNIEKGKHFQLIQEAGGILNGSTNQDRTNYYEKLPSNFLELALWLESDRMGFLLPALTHDKLKNQIDVVKNERLERYDNQPYGKAYEILINNLYSENHPYSWPTIGWMEDILSYSLDDVKDFFTKYYSTSNASIVVAGDIDENKTLDLINKYFGEIKSSFYKNNLSVKKNILTENKTVVYEDNVSLERIYFAWNLFELYNEDESSVEVLSDILTGSKNGHLHKLLIFENEFVQDVSSFQINGKFDGMYLIAATIKNGVEASEVKKLIFETIENIIKNGVTEEEVLRSKNNIKSNFVFGMQRIDGIANQINEYNFYLNNPDWFENDYMRFQNVTSDKVKYSASKYLSKPFLELYIKPKKDI